MTICNTCETESDVVEKTTTTVTYDCPNENCKTGTETQPRDWIPFGSALVAGGLFGTVFYPMAGFVAGSVLFFVVVWFGPLAILTLGGEVAT